MLSSQNHNLSLVFSLYKLSVHWMNPLNMKFLKSLINHRKKRHPTTLLKECKGYQTIIISTPRAKPHQRKLQILSNNTRSMPPREMKVRTLTFRFSHLINQHLTEFERQVKIDYKGVELEEKNFNHSVALEEKKWDHGIKLEKKKLDWEKEEKKKTGGLRWPKDIERLTIFFKYVLNHFFIRSRDLLHRHSDLEGVLEGRFRQEYAVDYQAHSKIPLNPEKLIPHESSGKTNSPPFISKFSSTKLPVVCSIGIHMKNVKGEHNCLCGVCWQRSYLKLGSNPGALRELCCFLT
ncbi:hypothetical protein VP01_5009g1 [Puccinia sorghi]|uniref:Uncharacterized protein n=1 Tax=Puccinia sorghi TaxID=27349 RepID=A0A0L6UMF9_9BASI|nr:hypothetical protein VP01_5009g1 [Puccinia sorghi]